MAKHKPPSLINEGNDPGIIKGFGKLEFIIPPLQKPKGG
jgi:hypothetical protein